MLESSHAAHKGAIWAMCWLPGQEQLLTGGTDGRLKLWHSVVVSEPSAAAASLKSQKVKETQVFESRSPITDIKVTEVAAGSKYLIAVCSFDSQLSVYSLSVDALAPVAYFELNAVSTKNATVFQSDAFKERCAKRLHSDTRPRRGGGAMAVDIDASGDILAVGDCMAQILLFDLKQTTEVASILQTDVELVALSSGKLTRSSRATVTALSFNKCADSGQRKWLAVATRSEHSPTAARVELWQVNAANAASCLLSFGSLFTRAVADITWYGAATPCLLLAAGRSVHLLNLSAAVTAMADDSGEDAAKRKESTVAILRKSLNTFPTAQRAEVLSADFAGLNAVAAVSGDGELLLWDLATQKLRCRKTPRTKGVFAAELWKCRANRVNDVTQVACVSQNGDLFLYAVPNIC